MDLAILSSLAGCVLAIHFLGSRGRGNASLTRWRQYSPSRLYITWRMGALGLHCKTAGWVEIEPGETAYRWEALDTGETRITSGTARSLAEAKEAVETTLRRYQAALKMAVKAA